MTKARLDHAPDTPPTAVIFAGPSVSGLDLLRWPRIAVLAPAAAGDLARAAADGVRFIGLVDGYFESRRAVWHKEILWAIKQGATVLGASSMGALRAAETHQFGMIGVGQIYALYRDGLLDDDDEVTLIHGTPEMGHLALSEAMVNIREAAESGRRCDALDENAAAKVLQTAKSLFYKDRTIEAISDALVTAGENETAARFVSHWSAGDHDVKKRDAILLLDEMARMQDAVDDEGTGTGTGTGTGIGAGNANQAAQRRSADPMPITEQFAGLLRERGINS